MVFFSISPTEIVTSSAPTRRACIYWIRSLRLLSFPSRKSNFKRKEQSRIFLDYDLFSTAFVAFRFVGMTADSNKVENGRR